MKGILVVSLCLLLTAIAYGGDWTVTVGGNSARDGSSDEVGPTDDTTIWDSGPYGAFCRQGAAENNIFVIARSFDSGDILHGTRLHAINAYKGTELWDIDMPVDFPDEDYRIQLLGINDSKVYATRSGNTHASYLYAFNAHNGTQVWRSEDTVKTTGSEGITYAPDGDLIVGSYNSVMRINVADGTTEWETARNAPSSDSCGVAVFGDECYGWQFGASGPKIRAYDLNNGDYLYESVSVAAGYVQQLGLFVGPDGTVYAPRSHNNPNDDALVAYTASSTSFTEKWRVDLGYVPFSTFAIGPDGSVYSYDRNDHIIRLNPDTGSILDTSEPVLGTMSCYLRTAVDSNGILYVTVAD